MAGEKGQSELAMLVAVHRPPTGVPPATALAELADLTRSVGGRVAAEEVFRVGPGRAFLGPGQRERLKGAVAAAKASFVVVSENLSRRHLNLLEEDLEVKVLDRTRLILDLFAQNARTSEAILQVEKAQLQYLLPRLTRRWTHLSRQVGGIGVRGPGETQIEVDRRRLRQRLSLLEGKLARIEGARAEQRKGREGVINVALVGYTNAGKSTLLNALTGAGVGVEDRLFTTLDPRARKLEVARQTVVVSDTVGFIRDLPHALVASFRATLGEAALADLLVEVLDASAPGVAERAATSEEILRDLGALGVPRWRLANKVDNCPDPAAAVERVQALDDAIPTLGVSALAGDGLEEFGERLEGWVRERLVAVRLRLTHAQAGILASLRAGGVVEAEEADGEGISVTALVPPAEAERLLGQGLGA